MDHVVSLTELHEQGQEDPQGDLKRLPDVLVLEGEHGERLLVRAGVAPAMGVLLLRHLSRISPRRVAPRGRDEEDQQENARETQRGHVRPGSVRLGSARL